jgi:hypothetical protein
VARLRFGGLAAAVVERLAPDAPPGVELREQPEGHLRAAIDEGRWEAVPLDEPELEEDVALDAYDPPYPAFGVLEALDFLQEFLADELADGWETGEPWAELDEDEIRFGFAGGATFEPIPLSAIEPSAGEAE